MFNKYDKEMSFDEYNTAYEYEERKLRKKNPFISDTNLKGKLFKKFKRVTLTD